MRTHRTARQDALLDELRHHPETPITSGQVMHLYARLGIGTKRATAQGDLQALAARGLLTQHGPNHRRHYTLRGNANA